MPARFLTLADVAELLSVETPAVRALIQSGEIRAIQVGGRRLWRIEESEFQAYVDRQYEASDARIAATRAGLTEG